MLNVCFCPCSVEDPSVLKSIGLVKHPQFMSCVYITLFLVTMLIIAQQVVFVSSREAPTPLLLTSACIPLLTDTNTEY